MHCIFTNLWHLHVLLIFFPYMLFCCAIDMFYSPSWAHSPAHPLNPSTTSLLCIFVPEEQERHKYPSDKPNIMTLHITQSYKQINSESQEVSVILIQVSPFKWEFSKAAHFHVIYKY